MLDNALQTILNLCIPDSFPNHLYFPKSLYNGNPKSEDSVQDIPSLL
jgi:hypothetical protein